MVGVILEKGYWNFEEGECGREERRRKCGRERGGMGGWEFSYVV